MVSDESSTQPATAADDATGLRPHRQVRLLVTVAAVILAVDIVTKVLAVRLLTPGQPVSIIDETVTWTLVRNSGAAFSMATGYTWVLTLIATGVVIGGVVVAPIASELILPIAMAVQNRLTVNHLAQTLSVYPSLSGSITEAARRLMAHDDLD